MCRSICIHGKGPGGGKYDNIRVGMNSRLDAIQAAVLLPKLKALADYELDVRQVVAARYSIAFAEKLQTPFVRRIAFLHGHSMLCWRRMTKLGTVLSLT